MNFSVLRLNRSIHLCCKISSPGAPRVAAPFTRLGQGCTPCTSRWSVRSSTGGAVWPDDSSRQYQPDTGSGPPDLNNWFQRAATWMGSAIQGISDTAYDLCPPRTSRQLVDTSVKAGLTLLALAFARSILSLVMTGGIVMLVLYILFRGFRGNGDHPDEPERGNTPPTETFENGAWTVVQPRRSSRGQWKSAQSDLVDVWIDESDDDDGPPRSTPRTYRPA